MNNQYKVWGRRPQTLKPVNRTQAKPELANVEAKVFVLAATVIDNFILEFTKYKSNSYSLRKTDNDFVFVFPFSYATYTITVNPTEITMAVNIGEHIGTETYKRKDVIGASSDLFEIHADMVEALGITQWQPAKHKHSIRKALTHVIDQLELPG